MGEVLGEKDFYSYICFAINKRMLRRDDVVSSFSFVFAKVKNCSNYSIIGK